MSFSQLIAYFFCDFSLVIVVIPTFSKIFVLIGLILLS